MLLKRLFKKTKVILSSTSTDDDEEKEEKGENFQSLIYFDVNVVYAWEKEGVESEQNQREREMEMFWRRLLGSLSLSVSCKLMMNI